MKRIDTLNIFARIFCAFGVMSSCVSNATDIHPEFKSVFDTFKGEAKKRKIELDKVRLKELVIKFGFDLNDYNTLGECNPNTFQVEISESYWVSASLPERETLLFHELGHCLLGRSHDDGLMPISGGHVYKSIMNSAGNALMYRFPTQADCEFSFGDCYNKLLFSPKAKNNFYNKFRKVYLDELFKFEVDAKVASEGKLSPRTPTAKGPEVPIPFDDFVSDDDNLFAPEIRAKLKRLCDSGDKEDACNVLGNVEQKLGNVSVAKSSYLKGCNFGNLVACDNLGLIEFNANNAKVALSYFRRACDAGAPSACAHLAASEQVDGKIADAIVHAKQSCDGKYMTGCYVLGVVKQKAGDTAEAKIYLKRACEGGVQESCRYMNGVSGSLILDPQVSEHYFFAVDRGTKLTRSNHGPKAVKNGQIFGIDIFFRSMRTDLKVTTVLVVPGSPENFPCKKCKSGELSISADRKTITKSIVIDGTKGHHQENWGIDEKDPRGIYSMSVFIEGNLIESATFEVK